MSLRNLPEIKAFQHSEILQFDAPDEAIARFNGEIRGAADDADNVITIYGQIGYDWLRDVDNTENRVSAALRRIGAREVVVNLNSPGGNYLSGLAIYNLLRAHPAKVTVNVVALAGSAASVIAMAGDDIQMADGSFIMVHNASAAIMGNKHDVRDAAEILADIDDSMAEIYAARSGAAKADATAWMDKGRGKGSMFNATSAIEKGLADRKMPSSAIKVSADTTRQIPPERVIERALMAANQMTSVEAKTLIAGMKTGKRDAAGNVTRDADGVLAAIRQLRSTIRS
jgi:ATP-dependent Clp protease protease subunit